MGESVRPGDVVVKKLMITSSRGSMDLTKSFATVDAYDSILMPTNVVIIRAFDSDDGLGQMRVSGDEKIEIEFEAPGSKPWKRSMVVALISEVNAQGAMKSKAYDVVCVSREAMMAKTNYVQKSYKSKLVSDMVQDVFKNYLKSSTSISTEATKATQDILVPNMKPFKAIDMLRRHAVSEKNKSSTYLFFENSQGFHFKTIEGLFAQGTVKKFKQEDSVGHSLSAQTENQIISWKLAQMTSSGDRIAKGALKHEVATFDPLTCQYVRKTVTPQRGTQGGSGDWDSGAFKSEYGQNPGRFSYLPIDGNLPKTFIPESTPEQLAYTADMMQNETLLRVNGDSALTCGTTIDAVIPKRVSTTDSSEPETMISGKFLVSSIRHRIGFTKEIPRYTCIMSCLKGKPEKGVA